jgi:hypothetical protein
MNISVYSRNNILQTMEYWKVPRDYADPIYNYLVHGYEPGSFFTAVLANDWFGAIQRSHPANTIDGLKAVSAWINEHMPKQCWGSYDKVGKWLTATDETRRSVLEKAELIFTEKDETWMALQGKPTHEPMLF